MPSKGQGRDPTSGSASTAKSNEAPSSAPNQTPRPFPWWKIRARRHRAQRRARAAALAQAQAQAQGQVQVQPANTDWSLTWDLVEELQVEFDPRYHWDKYGNKLPDTNGDTERILAMFARHADEYEKWMAEDGEDEEVVEKVNLDLSEEECEKEELDRRCELEDLRDQLRRDRGPALAFALRRPPW